MSNEWRESIVSIPDLKVGLFGPWLFQLGVGLREIGVDGTKIILDEQEVLLTTALRDEPELKDPDFALIDRWNSPRACLFPKSSALAKLFNQFDVLVVSFLGPMFAYYSKRPYFFWSAGFDLTGIPFPIQARFDRKRGPLRDAAAFVLAYWQRKGIRGANEIWMTPNEPFTSALDSVGEEGQFFPLAHNENLFRPVESKEEGFSESKTLRIFHPSRIMMSEKKGSIDRGQTKHTDRLFKGFSQAISNGLDAELVLVEQMFSPDMNAAHKIIAELGIVDNVRWENSPNQNGFSWRELAALYKKSDVVADDFGGMGWYGGVALEGLMSGLPVMSDIDDEVMARMHGDDHPFINVLTPIEIEKALFKLTDQEYRDSVGRFSREWAVEAHGRKKVAELFIQRLKKCGIT